ILNEIICYCEGCDFITLEVRISNSAAIGLYEKFGFVSQGIRKGFYSYPVEDANIMTLVLKD
ncbi:MAG: GNAT family N-acetyltransferase, partial [Monoglobales bacterium]